VAWSKIVGHRKPVIWGVSYVIWGNSYRGASPPSGGFCVEQNIAIIKNMMDEKYRCKFCKKFPDDPDYVRGLDARGNETHYCKEGKSIGIGLGIIFWFIFAVIILAAIW